MKTTLLLTALLAALPGCAPDLKHKAAIDSLQELQSARSVGINQRDFGTRVTDLKIKVDKLGNDPKYAILKEATRLLMEANMMWNGSIVGRLPDGTVRGIEHRHAKHPHVLGQYLSHVVDDPSLLHGESKQVWEVYVNAARDALFIMAQQATVEALGKAPAGTFASETAKIEARLQKEQDAGGK